jgi:hypothetical protein
MPRSLLRSLAFGLVGLALGLALTSPAAPGQQPAGGPAPAGQKPPAEQPTPAGPSAPGPNGGSFQPGPGILPPGASEGARARWASLVAALRAPSIEGPPRAFDVRFELLNRGGAGGALTPGSLDGKVRVRFLEPHFVAVTLESGKESGYGPLGYYLRDGKQRIELKGREYETDRRSIQQALSLAKNFVALANPATLTLFELSAPDGPPSGSLPKGDFNWKRLEWVEIHSPDFRLLEAPERWSARPGATDRYRARFGLDPETKLPRCVHLSKVLPSGAPAPAEQLVFLGDYRGLSGYTVPTRLLVFERQPAALEPGLREFLEVPERELYLLKDSVLNPKLAPEAFGG